MLTNELDISGDQSSVARASQRRKMQSNSSPQNSTNLFPLRTFHMHSSNSLQLVITRSFLSMLDAIQKTLKLGRSDHESNTASAISSDTDYAMCEQEEETLLERLRNRMIQPVSDDLHQDEQITKLEDFSDDNTDSNSEEIDENPSFNFLLKNQLGVDVSLEALHGFHVLI